MLITNGKIITWEKDNQILEEYALRIEKDKIVEVDLQEKLLERYPQDEKLDAGGQYVMPGNICAHTHFYGAYARGLGIPGPAPINFTEILGKLWFKLDQSLTMKDVRYSALVCMIDAIKHGTTTLIDHHASPNAIAGSLDEIAQAVEESGVRAALCYEVTDRGGEERMRAGIDENVRFLNYVKREKPLNGRLAATFGLHAGLTLSEKTLDICREALPDDSGFHIHVAEDPADEYDSLAKSGMRAVDRLFKHGILGPKTIVAHAVHVDTREINILADTGTWVTHQPRSNMNNAVGIAAVESMMRAGVKMGLGNDGMSNDMWEEWKATYFVHKLVNRDSRRMSAADIAQMAIYTNADLVNSLFETGPVGVLKPGAQADIIFVDYHPFTPLTVGNLPWHIVFGFHSSMITLTMVDGKVLMKDRELLTLDEEKIASEALRNAPGVWERFEKQF